MSCQVSSAVWQPATPDSGLALPHIKQNFLAGSSTVTAVHPAHDTDAAASSDKAGAGAVASKAPQSATRGHQGAAQLAKKPTRQRLYFIDWLRVVLTVFVVVNHVWTSFRPKGGDMYW
jgi:hypothetical protein